MFKRFALSILVACGLVFSFASVAFGDSPAPGYEVFGRFGPTDLSPGGTGALFLYVYNLGGAQGSEGPTVTDRLPAGLEAINEVNKGTLTTLSAGCSEGTVVTCQLAPIGIGGSPTIVTIPVRVSSDPLSEPDRVTVSGGGALGVANASVPVRYGLGPAPLGFANADAWVTNADGTVDTQAGSHPYELTVAFATNSTGVGGGHEKPSGGEPRFLDVNVPPGIVGEPGAVPKCTRRLFDGEACPGNTQIGENYPSVSGAGLTPQAVYNLVPPPGVAAEFAFTFNGISVFVDARIRSGGDYGITEHANIPQRKVVFNTTTIWGIPGEHGTGAEDKPLLTLPTSCGEPPQFSLEELGTWENESLNGPPISFLMHNSEDDPVGITGCEKLKHFQPFINLAPDTSFSDTPAGLSTIVKVPQGLNPEGLATPGLKETTV